MNGNVRYSSKRFFMTLMLCACSVILLQNYNLSNDTSFLFDLICVFAGLTVCFLFFLPSVYLKKRYDRDVFTLSEKNPKVIKALLAAVYAVYFLYVAVYFLMPYTEMFTEKYYTDASPCLISFLLIACCVYAAFKGSNVITRFGLFLFALAMLTNLLMFGGSISSLDFSNGFSFKGDIGSFLQNTVYFITPCFIAVIFACLAGDTRQFRLRHTVSALGLTGIKYALVLFFITYAVGEYALRQEYQTFVLSRVAHFGAYGGIESFYMALATMSVFMIISLLLCCMCRAVGKSGSIKAISVFSGVIFLLHLIAENQNSVKELLTQPVTLIAFSFFTAVVIPICYCFTGGKRYA